MKPFAAMFRALLVALAATGVLTAPVVAHTSAECKNDGVPANHHAKCCCGQKCRCLHCPAAGSTRHTPAPTSTPPDDGRVLTKIHSQAVQVCFVAACDVAEVLGLRGDFLMKDQGSATLIAQHTCLRM
jgi:hypothetical protein